MKKVLNEMKIKFLAISENESFSRIVIAGFCLRFDITPTELADIKTVVSEAVTNCIVHGYRGQQSERNFVYMEAKMYEGNTLYISVTDKGCGINDIEKAMEPFYTTDKEGERSGMGFSIMKSFTDSLRVTSSPRGTRVVMKKKLNIKGS